ncbi:hypothetical protein H2248_008008 [Termitomyces sp. 'cryptogamus']|nr:hypothetical protein H2248_008008 [Termitomyces sp. 'cryptogamus']
MQSPCSLSYLVDLTDVVAFSAKWLIESVYEESKILTAPNGIARGLETMNMTLEDASRVQDEIRRKMFRDNQYDSSEPCVRLRQELVNERSEYSHHPWQKRFEKICLALIGLEYFLDNWRIHWGSLSQNDRAWIHKYLNQNFIDSFTKFLVQWDSSDIHDLNQKSRTQVLPWLILTKLPNGLELMLTIPRNRQLFVHFITADGTPYRTRLELQYLSSTGWKRVLNWQLGTLEIFDLSQSNQYN